MDVFIIDGAGDFDPTVDISWHQIRRRDVIFFMAVIAEDKNSGVFQEFIDDVDRFDVLALSRNTRNKRKHASDIDPDFDSCPTGLVEFLDDCRIDKIIQLQDDIGLFSGFTVFDFILESEPSTRIQP